MGSGNAASSAPGIVAVAIVVAAIAIISVAVGRGALRLPNASPEPDSASPTMLLAFALAMLAMQQIGAGLGLAMAGGAPAPDASAMAVARAQSFATIGAALAQAPVIVVGVRLWRRRDPCGERPLRAVAVGIVTGMVMWPSTAAIAAFGAAVQERLAGTPMDALAHETLRLIVAPEARPWSAILALLAAIVAPVVEETLYRGLLQPAVRAAGAGPWSAIIAVAAIFALMHWSVAPPPAVAALFVLGIALGWVKERTGGLAAPVVAHAVFNGANLLLAA